MKNTRYARQSFLGSKSNQIISGSRVGVVGLGGGGSHIVQQLAHIGFKRYVLYDADNIEESNLNRTVGARSTDPSEFTPKLQSAIRLIQGLDEDAEIEGVQVRWQKKPEPLIACDLIFSAVDGFQERLELEAHARRHLIPLIDIGMDVQAHDSGYKMFGQVVLSMPGNACMICMSILSELNLAREAGKYGDAGPRPQVIWCNGVLASAAVGIAVDLLTDWTHSLRGPVYLAYDGNRGLLTADPLLEYVQSGSCPHYPLSAIGAPLFKKV